MLTNIQHKVNDETTINNKAILDSRLRPQVHSTQLVAYFRSLSQNVIGWWGP